LLTCVIFFVKENFRKSFTNKKIIETIRGGTGAEKHCRGSGFVCECPEVNNPVIWKKGKQTLKEEWQKIDLTHNPRISCQYGHALRKVEAGSFPKEGRIGFLQKHYARYHQ
jgi:hypothetical protein